MTGWISSVRGNVAVWFAMASLAVAGLAGGGLTMSRLNGAGTRLQDMADGAALAAAVQAQDPRATDARIADAARRFGKAALEAGPYESSAARIDVAVVRRSPAEVTVTFDQEVRTILAGFVGRDRISIRRRATAVVGPERKTCLHVLEPAAPAALEFRGNVSLSAPDCMVQVNSTAAGAVAVRGGAASARADAVHIAGPASPLRGWTPAPLFGQPALADPLGARTAWPTAGECAQQPAQASVLSPGTYCGGLTLRSGERLEPGLYVIKTGGVSVSRLGAQGRGVTLVLLDPQGVLDINSNARLSLSAPTSGDWAGIALAAKPGPGLTTSTIHGVLELDGAVYLPGQRLHLQGNARVGGPAGARRELVVRQLLAKGTPDLDLAGGHPSGVHGAVRLSR